MNVTQPTLPIELLRPNPENPRAELGDVDELAESIRRFGILEPLVVSPDGASYLVVCGHRRVAAAKRVGLTEVPVVIRPMDGAERELVALTENVHRRQLSPVEEAIAYARLMKVRHLTQRDVARLMHVHESTISQRLALLRLPKPDLDRLHRGELTIAEALGLEQDLRRSGRAPNPPKFNAGRKSKCTLEGHVTCDGRRCEVKRMTQRRHVA